MALLVALVEAATEEEGEEEEEVEGVDTRTALATPTTNRYHRGADTTIEIATGTVEVAAEVEAVAVAEVGTAGTRDHTTVGMRSRALAAGIDDRRCDNKQAR